MNKPNFKYNETVSFDTGGDQAIKGKGLILGRASEGVIDIWIIGVIQSNIDSEDYPYTAIALPHTLITRSSG